MSAKAAKVRLAVVIDWDAGLPIAGPCEPVDDVLPGGQYTVECSPQEQVLIQEIEIRSFALAWIAVGGHEIKPIGTVQGTSEIRRYLLEEPVFVRAAETVSMGLKNDGGWSLKPKIAMFARLPPALGFAAPLALGVLAALLFLRVSLSLSLLVLTFVIDEHLLAR
jgi:hypothetical protein